MASSKVKVKDLLTSPKLATDKVANKMRLAELVYERQLLQDMSCGSTNSACN
jgi:hypothetical protein